MHPRSPLIYAFVIFLTACTAVTPALAQLTSTEVGRTMSRPLSLQKNGTMFAWSSWGAWSACSKSCGGGVAVQERQCLPRDPARWRRSRKRRKVLKNPVRSRRARSVNNEPDCPGLGRRYHECNTAQCPGPIRDPRSEQCAVYDRRPFRGRFYTWVPYVDGNSPCTLNCRPRGQQFYASLALVADGTPCTKPGFRAICVQGNCKVVGRETVLASSATQDLHCGRKLVSGLFTRARLPLGYSYVTTVPRGACRLNISEIVSSENYIALKVTNGSYIMNGEFAVSAPGTYDAVGTRFIYTRSHGQDSVFAVGPTHHPIDIMILYTQPNPSIKYEYLSDTVPNETSNDIPTAAPPSHHSMQRHHRHHNAESHIRALEQQNPGPSLSEPNYSALESQSQNKEQNEAGDRKFMWKILSYTQCSRSCGGGLQIAKFKCVEVDGDKNREVSPGYCKGIAPNPRRRRCGTAPCQPRWRATAWGPCPVCGPAHRTRIVGCVQDHARGITKISDQKCPLPMPPSKAVCDIPNCDGTTVSSDVPRPDARRQVRTRDRIDSFREGPVITLSANATDNDLQPTAKPAFSYSGGDGWLYTEWSECVGWCLGGGVQSRGVRCADPGGCTSTKTPDSSQSCSVKKCDAQWFSSEWSPCSASCDGRQVRAVICIGGNGRRLRDASCHAPKPDLERACGGNCNPSWYMSDWSECKGPCESGIQSRTVWCARGGAAGASGAAKDTECAGVRPHPRRSCVPPRCSTRPVLRPAVNPPATVSDPQQRVTRHQSHNTQNFKDRSLPNGACVDKLNNCALAVQARLCHYPYYGEYCCQSCHTRDGSSRGH